MTKRHFVHRARRLSPALALLVVALALGCGKDSKVATESDRGGGLWAIAITSDAFENNGTLSAKYTADGANVSPPLRWSRGPGQTREYVVVIEDPDAPGDMPAVHWLVYGLSPETTSLPEGAASEPGLLQGTNYTGVVGYAGPNPPKGKPHRYFVQVMALAEPLDLGPGASLSAVLNAMKQEALSKGRAIATYGREPG